MSDSAIRTPEEEYRDLLLFYKERETTLRIVDRLPQSQRSLVALHTVAVKKRMKPNFVILILAALIAGAAVWAASQSWIIALVVGLLLGIAITYLISRQK